MTHAALLRSLLIAILAVPLVTGCSSEPSQSGGQKRSAVNVASVPAEGISESSAIPEGDTVEAKDGETPPARRPVVRVRGAIYSCWHLEFSTAEACAAFKVEGAPVFARFDKWADAYVPNRNLERKAILSTPGLVWMDVDNEAIFPPQPPAEQAASRATPEPIVRGGINGLKGKGVTIAIVDSGLDFRHPDFITTDAQGKPSSRVAWLWDTTSEDHTKGIGEKGPLTYPNGAPVGTVYSREVLTAELRSAEKKIGSTDTNGHGTSCAGVAAGNGSAYADRRYSGVAPEADLIGVRIGGAGRGLENAYLLGAICEWVDRMVGKHPVVISCSFGGQYSGRDGVNVLERQLDARFAASVKSRAICIAAGNEAQQILHAETAYKSDQEPGKIEWTVPEGGKAVTFVHFSSGDCTDLNFVSVGKDEASREGMQVQVNAFTKQARISLVSGPGSFAINLYTGSGAAGSADAYITTIAGGKPAVFTGTCVSTRKQVASPGTTLQAITVGSYDFNDQLDMNNKKYTYSIRAGVPMTLGAISAYSNPGPRRFDSAVKPDLVAPGQFHTASRVLDLPKGEREFVESSGKYHYFNGTSAATPYCAGVIALMFEKNPGLSVGEIQTLLHTKPSKDKQTGSVPNPVWGHGKLDVAAVRAILTAVKAP